MLSVLLVGLLISLSPSAHRFATAASPPSNVVDSPPSASSYPSSSIVATAILAGHYDVSGQVQFTLQQALEAVGVTVSVTGLMALNSSASYTYHIHTNPISSDGNCSSALGHLDPLNVTDALVCDPSFSQYCQEGDLAGRNGKLLGNQTTANATYMDKYLRFWPQPFSILGRSIVVHMPNSTRIACGNITAIVDGTADSEGKPTLLSSNYTNQYPTQAPPAPAVKYEPFVGATAQPAVLSQITLPNPLPSLSEVPNVILGTNMTTQNLTLPAALPAAKSFNYTLGAVLPTQPVSSNNTIDSSRGVARNAATSGANKFHFKSSFLASLIAGLMALLV